MDFEQTQTRIEMFKMFLCLSILTYNANAIIQTALLVP